MVDLSRRRWSQRGTSLIELMVALAITAVISTAAFLVMNEGLQLYRTNKRAADVQVDVLQILTRVTTEAVNAKSELIKPYSASGPELSGLVFASPLLPDGKVRLDDVTAEIYWQKWICYYFVPADPATGKLGQVFRAEEQIPPDDSGGTGSKQIDTVVKLGVDTKTTNHFQTAAGIERRLLGSDIAGLDVFQYAGDVTSSGSPTATFHDAYDIVLKAGDELNTSSTGYYIEVNSRVRPRG